MASALIGWGISSARLLTRIKTRAATVAPLREGNCGCSRIRCTFTETATMTSPTKVAEAPAAVVKNSFHSSTIPPIKVEPHFFEGEFPDEPSVASRPRKQFGQSGEEWVKRLTVRSGRGIVVGGEPNRRSG